VLQQLHAAGVRVVRTGGEHAFEGLIANVGLIADALGRRAEGERLIADLQREWAATRAAVRTVSPLPRVMFILSHAANSVQISGAGTAADAMIRLAGGTNALLGPGSNFNGYRPLSAEAAIAAAPDVLLVTREGLVAVGGIQVLLDRPGLALTPAGKARRVVAPDALLLLGFGPRLPQAVRELATGFGTAA
jgi:iron complex transport system substrate-binding protein